MLGKSPWKKEKNKKIIVPTGQKLGKTVKVPLRYT